MSLVAPSPNVLDFGKHGDLLMVQFFQFNEKNPRGLWINLQVYFFDVCGFQLVWVDDGHAWAVSFFS